jgi:hypothetical protein
MLKPSLSTHYLLAILLIAPSLCYSAMRIRKSDHKDEHASKRAKTVTVTAKICLTQQMLNEALDPYLPPVLHPLVKEYYGNMADLFSGATLTHGIHKNILQVKRGLLSKTVGRIALTASPHHILSPDELKYL